VAAVISNTRSVPYLSRRPFSLSLSLSLARSLSLSLVLLLLVCRDRLVNSGILESLSRRALGAEQKRNLGRADYGRGSNPVCQCRGESRPVSCTKVSAGTGDAETRTEAGDSSNSFATPRRGTLATCVISIGSRSNDNRRWRCVTPARRGDP